MAGGAGAAPVARSGGPAPLVGADKSDVIKGQYIIVTRAGEADSVRADAKSDGAKIRYTYRTALNGFAATLDADGLEAVRANPDVAYVEADRKVSINATQSPATWGLDRIDQRALPLSNSYTYEQTGAGVTAYIIDTGLRLGHNEFSGRAVSGYTAISDGRGTEDCNGHGTHVGGTVGGETYGVAKDVKLVAVRVLDCGGSGSTSGVIQGIDWVTSNHTSGPAVANMSLGGGASTSLDNAVVRSINDGVTYAVAAGNDNTNACNGSPARTPAAITVGATTSSDARSSFSNYGNCLDIFAPGSSITSSWYTSNTATAVLNGTSMATPHVAGAAALYLQANPSAAPAAVRDALVNSGTTGVVTNAGSGSPNVLLYTLGGSSPPGPGPGTCASLANTYTNTLSSRQSRYSPSDTGFSSNGGNFRGCLDGPNGVDFDLYLQKRTSSGSWTTVAQGITPDPDEDVTYSGTAGTYRWRIYAYSGSGAYTLKTQHP
jgi:subtilisin family serine protease